MIDLKALILKDTNMIDGDGTSISMLVHGNRTNTGMDFTVYINYMHLIAHILLGHSWYQGHQILPQYSYER